MDEQAYPPRVAQGDDGVYRWSYDMDMYRNHYLRNVLLKVFGVISFVCCAFLLFLFAKDHNLTREIALTILLIFAGVMLLVLGGYYLAAVIMHGKYHLRFEMNEEAILLVRTPSTQAFMDAMADISSLTGRGAAARTAAASGLTYFSQVRSLKEHPDYHAFNLRTLADGNQIWVCPEDYPFVVDYVKSRIPEKAAVR